MSHDNDVETSLVHVDPLVGTIFDKRFRVEERIAAGGFGAIYRATHVKSGHQIALKVLLPALAQDLGVVARFRREGDTLTALRSPHTINAYELGQAADRTLFIVMELLHGESLFERYKANGPFEWKRMVQIARQVCESLEEAHGKGIVHRDLKPTNIHLENHGDDPDYVKVLDFGIAKILRGGDFDPEDLTNAGQMIGTIDYMSPEQMVGAKVTGQTDIYTVGIVMYEMIAGCLPFGEAMTAAQALGAVMKTRPEPLYLRAPVPEELDRIVMRCLERDVKVRYQTVRELRLDLARLLAGVGPDRAKLVETKPVEKEELTELTPEPEKHIAESRRSRRPSDEHTAFTPPPEKLLAESRRSRRPSDEHTAFTPPPEHVLEELRSGGRRTHPPAIEWDDDDEHAQTSGGRGTPPSADDHERVTKVARLADIAAAAQAARSGSHDEQPTEPADETERVTKVARAGDLVASRAPAMPTADEEQATMARLGKPRDGGEGEFMTSVARSSRPPSNAAPGRPPSNAAPGRPPSGGAPSRSPSDGDRVMTLPRGQRVVTRDDRAMTNPRDERAATNPRDERATVRDDHAMTLHAGGRLPSPLFEDSGVIESVTPPLARWADDSSDPHTPTDPRRGEQRVTPTTSRRSEPAPRSTGARPTPDAPMGVRKLAASKLDSGAPSAARKGDAIPPPLPGVRKGDTIPPPLPGVRKGEMISPPSPSAPARTGSRTAPPSSAQSPPRSASGTSGPSAQSPSRTQSPPRTAAGMSASPPSMSRPLPRNDTPVPQVVVAPFSPQPKLPTPVPQPPIIPTGQPGVITPPGVLPYAPTMPAMGPYPGRPSPVPGPPLPAGMPSPVPGLPSPTSVSGSISGLPSPMSVVPSPIPGTSSPDMLASVPSLPLPAAAMPGAAMPGSVMPGVQPQVPTPQGMPPQGMAPHGMAPYQTPPPRQPYAPGSPYAPSPVPQLPSTPFSSSMPYQPYPQQPRVDLAPQQRATRSYDMGRQAAREAAIRKLVWLIVLIVAGITGIILATQL